MKKPSLPAMVALICGLIALVFFLVAPKPEAPQVVTNSKASPPPVPITDPAPVDAGDELFSRIGGLEKGATISLPLPGGKTTEGRLNYVKNPPEWRDGGWGRCGRWQRHV